MFVHEATNELFVADGYVNRRVIVFDADTGAFKRLWGAYGKPPDDAAPNTPQYSGEPSRQFNTVHGIRVSLDGRVYVADRHQQPGAGVFHRRALRARSLHRAMPRSCWAPRSRWHSRRTSISDTSTSPTPATGRCTFSTARRCRHVTKFGRIGRYAGQFVFLHNVAVDSYGSVYTTEVGGGRRVQKFMRR